jgi:hypothetical protein
MSTSPLVVLEMPKKLPVVAEGSVTFDADKNTLTIQWPSDGGGAPHFYQMEFNEEGAKRASGGQTRSAKKASAQAMDLVISKAP